jgi:hypothetical protein
MFFLNLILEHLNLPSQQFSNFKVEFKSCCKRNQNKKNLVQLFKLEMAHKKLTCSKQLQSQYALKNSNRIFTRKKREIR